MFKINQVVFDSENKEFVKLTNGTAELDGSNFVPTEGIAIRFIGFNNGKPVLAHTYRSVNPDKLGRDGVASADAFDALFQTQKPVNYEYIGRV